MFDADRMCPPNARAEMATGGRRAIFSTMARLTVTLIVCGFATVHGNFGVPRAALAQAVVNLPQGASGGSFVLDLAAQPVGEIALTVAAPGEIPFKIIRGSAGIAPVSLDLAEFANEQHVMAPVLFRLGGTQGPGVSHLDFGADVPPVIPVDLIVPSLPTGGKFSGKLMLTATTPTTTPAGALPFITVWRFVLTSVNDVHPATLVIDQSTVALTAVRPWCLPWRMWCTTSEDPSVSVHVRDKTGSWPLDGVIARLEPGMVAPGSGTDLRAHLVGSFGDETVADLFASPVAGRRTVPAHGQATVKLVFKDLAVGEYSFPLRFTAANSGDDDAQRLTVSVKMRNSVVGAILILVFGATMSFIATRVVGMLRQRAQFLERLRDLRPDWLAEEPPSLPVIGLRAALRQAEDLSSRFWLTGIAEIDARLDAAKIMLSVIERVRAVRNQLETGIHHPVVRLRAFWILEKITRDIGVGPRDAQVAASLTARLDDLAKWCDPAQQEPLYWADLKPAIATLCDEIDLTAFDTDEAKRAATDLIGLLRTAIGPNPLDLHGKTIAEANYGRLGILWELRSHRDEIEQLTKSQKIAGMAIEDVYRFVDDFWWKRLRSDPAGLGFAEQPTGDSPTEAYAIVTLRVQAVNDPGLDHSYLMHKKLTWHWTITTRPRRAFWGHGRHQPSVDRHLESTEPRIAQYATQPGTMIAAVSVDYDGQKGPAVKQDSPLAIGVAGDFRIWRFFETADIIATGLAMLAAIVSGVSIHALEPTFGTAKDYLALFTWGAGIDQGKNFLQSLAVYSSTDKPHG